jgi:transposase
MRIAVLGVDLGKNVCSLVGLNASGAVVLRRRAKRETVIALAAKLSRCIVGMEACCGAHHLGRVFAAYGHDVRLMSPEYVRPYVKAQKNDDRDAEGIAEAATRPTMRFVELKSQEQLDCRRCTDRPLVRDIGRGAGRSRRLSKSKKRRSATEIKTPSMISRQCRAIAPSARASRSPISA